MTICLGKSCSFGLLCVSFVNLYKSVCVFVAPALAGCDIGVRPSFIPQFTSTLVAFKSIQMTFS